MTPHLLALALALTLLPPCTNSSPPPLPPISWAFSNSRAMPVSQNSQGSANLRPDLISLGPIPLGGFSGNLFNSTMTVNDQTASLSSCSWESCSSTRAGLTPDGTHITSTVRMPLDDRVIMQTWDVAPSADKPSSTVSLYMDGPFFRTCDDPASSSSSSCGWGLTLPTDKENFELSTVQINGAFNPNPKPDPRQPQALSSLARFARS